MLFQISNYLRLQIAYNNVYIRFITMYYTILSSLCRSIVYVDQFFEKNFCPILEANRIGNDLNSKNILVLWRLSFFFSVEAS